MLQELCERLQATRRSSDANYDQVVIGSDLARGRIWRHASPGIRLWIIHSVARHQHIQYSSNQHGWPDHYARLAAASRLITILTAGRPIPKAPEPKREHEAALLDFDQLRRAVEQKHER
jgi:hypothetical protein